jgi:hypothetical protein
MNTPSQVPPAVNLSAKLPEWSVIGIPYQGNDEHLDKIAVYQNGALVATATADEPTYDALSELAAKANAHAGLVDCVRDLLEAAKLAESALQPVKSSPRQPQVNGALILLPGAISSARAALAKLQA